MVPPPAPQVSKERLLACITMGGLPPRTQRAAQFVLTRLDKQPKDAKRQPMQVSHSTLVLEPPCPRPPPPPLPPSSRIPCSLVKFGASYLSSPVSSNSDPFRLARLRGFNSAAFGSGGAAPGIASTLRKSGDSFLVAHNPRHVP